MNNARFDSAEAILRRHVEERTTPAAAAGVVAREGLVAALAVGRHRYAEDAPEMRVDDLFDLASVTKVVATATICAMLVDDGLLDLDQPVEKTIPEFAGEKKSMVTPRLLLSHSSGMPAHVHLYDALRNREEIVEAAIALDLQYPSGSASVYSDMGYLILGEMIERICGATLDVVCRERVTEPMALFDTSYNPTMDQDRIVPTEIDSTIRQCLVHGEVHDENAWAMGGVAPHSGLFSTVGDLGRFVRMWLCDGELDGTQILAPDTVRLFTKCASIVEDSTWALGWDTRSPDASTSGQHFSMSSYGILGFTGTSLWVDPEQGLGVILLTNRVHPTRDGEGIMRLRPELHDAVVEGL